jgi:hypothetical protein
VCVCLMQRVRGKQFATGLSRIPPTGFAGLRPRFEVVVNTAASADTLPTAHTCFNRLELPRCGAARATAVAGPVLGITSLMADLWLDHPLMMALAVRRYTSKAMLAEKLHWATSEGGGSFALS